MAIGANGRVGSIAWHANPSTAGMIEPGWARDDANVAFADVTLPPGFVWGPSSGNINGTNYTYVLGDANYMLPQLSMTGNSSMIVTGRASLYVSGAISLRGHASIIIAPGASLTLSVAGPSASIGGSGVINQNANALTFSYCELRSNTSLDLWGNGTCIGTICAPNAWVTLGGVSDQHFIGAVVAKAVRMNAHFNFHYDENLKHAVPAY